ncbi:unnamed protein product [Bursaphelenchus okinawaensis]|uniref:C2 domain-containing protein n=1 Tax=Bursaphelenchus okinawaensis TaxID=465554 RepID=A0A811JTP2_9BILA|nr:unnamed protein product [Bursaphelenchus okinawaensis]CAG9082819.1 unnamed protein product [Bursaphelenchus okinawaensis]
MSTAEKRLQRIAELRKQVLVGALPDDFLRMPTSSNADANAMPLDPATQFYSFIPPNTRGRLVLKIVEAKLTKNYGLVRMDPYIRVRVGNAVFETHTCINGGKVPVWNRVINAYLPVGVESIYVQIFDERSFTQDECVAWAHIILPDGVFGQETVDEWYSLSGPQGEGKEGVLNIVTSFTPVVTTEGAPAPATTGQMVEPPEPVDIGSIKEMFPEVDEEVIRTILESNNNNQEATVNALIEMSTLDMMALGWCLGVGVLVSLLYAKFMFDLHENTLWFSNIKEVEREISFRTESGLYYSYYKQVVNASTVTSAFYDLIHDTKTEYPREINVLQRFNIIPEVLLALFYRLSSSYVTITPIMFYVNSSFLLAGLSVLFVYLLTYVITGAWSEAFIVSVWMLVNYEDSSRVNFAVNMREVYALPFLWVQFMYVFKSLDSVVYIVLLLYKLPKTFHLVKSTLVFLFGIVVMLPLNVVVKSLVSDKSDSHIWHFVASKLGVAQASVPFETTLYLCHGAFAFLGYDFIERTYKNGSVQLFVFALVVSVFNIVRSWWKGEQSCPRLFLLTVKCCVFGVLAFSTMRMKYIFLPLMLILASTAFSFVNRLLGRFAKLTIILALAITVLRSHYSFYLRVMSHEQEFYDPDTVRLMEWINQQNETMVFSGSMQLMAGVKCCTGRPITNHPHFEDSYLRERTLRIYQMYGRRPADEVYGILKNENATHIILEDSICLAKSTGCALKDLVDQANGQQTESGRYPFVPSRSLQNTVLPRFCDVLRKKGHSQFALVFRNRTFRVYRLLLS